MASPSDDVPSVWLVNTDTGDAKAVVLEPFPDHGRLVLNCYLGPGVEKGDGPSAWWGRGPTGREEWMALPVGWKAGKVVGQRLKSGMWAMRTPALMHCLITPPRSTDNLLVLREGGFGSKVAGAYRNYVQFVQEDETAAVRISKGPHLFVLGASSGMFWFFFHDVKLLFVVLGFWLLGIGLGRALFKNKG